MNWNGLLSLKRFGDTQERLRSQQDETRLGFDVDYDRIIFSSAFRSLQDKTQVIPLPMTLANTGNFVHTRLTHSLEVSVVARSLGRSVGSQLLKKYPGLRTEMGHHFNDFGAIVAAAALAHDIGNPPFGHSGEKAIGSYFSHGKGQRYQDELSAAEFQDLADFEGNANGFRLLVASKNGVEGGLRLSYATLGAFLKYPKASLPKKPTHAISDKKYGFFQAQQPFFLELAETLGLLKKEGRGIRFHRHPLAYLVEAADDICYTIIDFEDGINLGLISYDHALEYLVNLVKDTINTKKYHGIATKKEQLSYLRALAIGTLVNEAATVFLDNEADILAGRFEHALLEKSKFEAQTQDIISLCVEKVYRSDQVVEKEIMGHQILTNLMDAVSTALLNTKKGNARSFDALLLKKLGMAAPAESDPTYSLLLRASGYVAGLSDGAAVALNGLVSGNGV